MTFEKNDDARAAPAILTPEVQEKVWFLGALVRVRATGAATSGCVDVLEHRGERGYGSPLHRHLTDDETFFVLDGELRVEVGGDAHAAGPGAVAFLPRQLPHGRLRQIHGRCRDARRRHRHNASRRATAGSDRPCGTGKFVWRRDLGTNPDAVIRCRP